MFYIKLFIHLNLLSLLIGCNLLDLENKDDGKISLEVEVDSHSTMSEEIENVGQITLAFEANTFDENLNINVEKIDPIDEQYTQYDIIAGGPAVSIMPDDTDAKPLKPFTATLPLTLSVSSLIASSEIERKSENLAVLRIFHSEQAIIYPVELIDSEFVRFKSDSFGSFQAIFIEASDAEQAAVQAYDLSLTTLTQNEIEENIKNHLLHRVEDSIHLIERFEDTKFLKNLMVMMRMVVMMQKLE